MMSLSQKFSCAKRKIWAMLKKERKSMSRGMRKKRNIYIWTSVQTIKHWVLRCLSEKKKRKERNKDSPYFQNKVIHPKREIVMIQGVPKIFRLRTS
jgi:hypothetical protein